jgi:hypothetical protein
MTKGVALAAVVLALAGCAAPTNAIDELRERFVAAGGECSAPERFELAAASHSLRCANGALLHTVETDADRAKVVDFYLESDNVRARTHIMLGAERWIIVDTISVIVTVMPKLGGIIHGRNGANP